MLIKCTCGTCGKKYTGLVLSSQRLFFMELMLAARNAFRSIFPVPSPEEIILYEPDPANLPENEVKYTICLHCRAENPVTGREKAVSKPGLATMNYAQGRLGYISAKGVSK